MEFVHKEYITILGKKIKAGESCELNFGVANLHTTSSIDVPVFVERSKKPGPVVLFTAGIHGDEVNGVEIVRQLIAKGINKPKGSLASRVAFELTTEIVTEVDFILDFHTGGAGRFNAPQIRIAKNNPELDQLAKIFGAPFVLYSKHLKKSFRNTCFKLGKTMLLFEGGKSFHIDNNVTNTAVNGAKRILHHFGMLQTKFKVTAPKKESLFITGGKWQRANYSGMFKASAIISTKVTKGDIIGNITDPYGQFNHFVKANHTGYIINVNESPIVYQGDALFHITTKLKK